MREVSIRVAKCDCGGLWKFDLSLVDRHNWSIFCYRAFLPLEGNHWREITLSEGLSPIVPLDEDVLLKMDYFMPTLSFKHRGAAMLIAHCKAIGVDALVQDSSGNAGNSVAAYCSAPKPI
jgi:threonine synthase